MNKFYIGLKSVCFQIIFFLVFPIFVSAQETDTSSSLTDEDKAYTEQAEQLIKFLEYTFNTLGDPEVPARDKDIIINQSYLKFFRDGNVQIEDDLDENRYVVTNKDVQAYLKDINFFFKTVAFQFDIEEVSQEINEKRQAYFKVTLNRNLKGITIDGDSVNNNQNRYIEINLDERNQDMKIASIYTTRLNEDEEIANWWLNLSPAWQSFFLENMIQEDSLNISNVVAFGDSLIVISITDSVPETDDSSRLHLPDSLSLADFDSVYLNINDSTRIRIFDTISADTRPYYKKIRRLWGITHIDISGNKHIKTLAPLKKLTGLNSLDISNSLINDLTPIRNLTELKSFDCSGTPVSSLEPLHYSEKLVELNIENSAVSSLEVIKNFTLLEVLNCNHTAIDNLEPLAEISSLKELRCRHTTIDYLAPLENLTLLKSLDLSNTNISSLEPLRNLININYLLIDHTNIKDVGALEQMTGLKYLYMDYTTVGDLDALLNLPDLERIYCDNTNVDQTVALDFLKSKPEVLLVYESAELNSWWVELSNAWKQVFSYLILVDSVPSKEQLHQLTLINQVDINGSTEIDSLNALVTLINLAELDISNTNIKNLEPLKENIHLQAIHASHSQLSDLEPLKNLLKLSYLDIANTPVNSISPLAALSGLKHLNIEHTKIEKITPIAALNGLDVIYCDFSNISQPEVIAFKELNEGCLIIFQTDILQGWWEQLPEAWTLLFNNMFDLSKTPTKEQLQQIADTEEISIKENNNIRNLEPLTIMIKLRKLHCSNMPINNLDPLRKHHFLEELTCSDTPIVNIEPVTGLGKINYLDISNTQISDFESIQNLSNLELLNISGTPVKNLKFLTGLKNLKQVEFFNTKVNNLKYLNELMKLELVKCYNTSLNEKRVNKFKQSHPDTEVVYY